jgi:TonB-linked SusC/RagA family outer membrane protein
MKNLMKPVGDLYPHIKKLTLIMRLSVLLMLIAVFSSTASVYSQATKLTIKMENARLSEVFDAIEDQSEFYFFYNRDYFNDERIVSVDFENKLIDEILKELFKNEAVKYEIYDRNILLTIPEASLTTAKREVMQQQRSVSGKVTDSGGQPLPGVTVVVKGTTQGTVTDADGNYSLTNIPEDATLVFSFVGMRTQEVEVGSQTVINATMVEETIGLEEVVAVGYGTQKKVSLTSAVSDMEGEQIESLPITDLSNSIGGRLSGVIVKQYSGEPGYDYSDIYIRGISTIGSHQPLILVDGIERDFAKLDPNTIESITVLKDAAAVAPFGIGGANGVILVTTKQGLTGKPTVSYNGYIGFQNPTVVPDWCNSYEYATLINIAAENEGFEKPYSDEVLQKFKDGSDPDLYPPHFDVWDELTNKNAPLYSHSFEVSGGTEKIKYYTNFGYQYQNGLWDPTHASRYNLTMNLQAMLTNTTKMDLRIVGKLNSDARPPGRYTGRHLTDDIFALLSYAHPATTGPMFFSDGTPGHYVSAAIFNSGTQKKSDAGLYTNISIEQEIPFIPGLKFKGSFSYDPDFIHNKIWATPMEIGQLDTSVDPPVMRSVILGNKSGLLIENRDESKQLTYQANVNYSNNFGPHTIGFTGVWELKDYEYATMRTRVNNYIVPIDEIDMGSSASADRIANGTSRKARQMGLVYRLSYDFKGKYLIESSGRYDGHYYFAPGKRWGFFPSISAGWRLSEENFLKDRIHNLKLRVSYGESGALAGSPFQYLTSYSVSGSGYVIAGNGVSVSRERASANLDITWERAKKTNIGLDIGLLKGQFEIMADYFYEKRSDMLVSPNVIVPVEYGIGLNQENAGVMENKGTELSVNFHKKMSNDLFFSLNTSFVYAKNKLLEIFETPSTYDNPNRRITGRALGTLFGYKSLGYFQEDDFDSDGNLKPGIAQQPWGKVKPGDIRYQDTNGNGKIDVDDQVPIGLPEIPQIIYGISPNIQYKNFILDLFFQGTARSESYFSGLEMWPFPQGRNAHRHNFDFWTPENPNAMHPRLTSAPTPNNTQTSSHWVKDVSYLRLKNATLSYNISSILGQKIQDAQIYIGGQNILTFTKQKIRDPEIRNYNVTLYPNQKVISIGFRFKF